MHIYSYSSGERRSNLIKRRCYWISFYIIQHVRHILKWNMVAKLAEILKSDSCSEMIPQDVQSSQWVPSHLLCFSTSGKITTRWHCTLTLLRKGCGSQSINRTVPGLCVLRLLKALPVTSWLIESGLKPFEIEQKVPLWKLRLGDQKAA